MRQSQTALLALLDLDTLSSNAKKAAKTAGLRRLFSPMSSNITTKNRGGSILETKSVAGFKFDLVGCRISGNELDCQWLITNTGTEDKRLWVFRDVDNGGSRAWDEYGNSFSARIVTLANTENAGYIPLGSQPILRIKFVSSVNGAGRISKLEIVGMAGDTRFKIDFRDIRT